MNSTRGILNFSQVVCCTRSSTARSKSIQSVMECLQHFGMGAHKKWEINVFLKTTQYMFSEKTANKEKQSIC